LQRDHFTLPNLSANFKTATVLADISRPRCARVKRAVLIRPAHFDLIVQPDPLSLAAIFPRFLGKLTPINARGHRNKPPLPEEPRTPFAKARARKT
jgi:hypothetical protein